MDGSRNDINQSWGAVGRPTLDRFVAEHHEKSDKWAEHTTRRLHLRNILWQTGVSH
jgi:hypothetical protein